MRLFIISCFLIYQPVLCVNHSGKKAPNHRFVYVAAPGGMRVRASPQIDSKSVGVMPYGQRLTQFSTPLSGSLEIDSLPGGWANIELDQWVSGYAFDGYLIPVPPPALSKTKNPLKSYQQKLSNLGYKTKWSQTELMFEGSSKTTPSLLIPCSEDRAVFLISKILFQASKKMAFPSKYRKYIVNSKPDKDVWLEELRFEKDKAFLITEIKYLRKEKSRSLIGKASKKGNHFEIAMALFEGN